uniref:Rap-GAP domain-containing protein n=1 Tax=Strigamia maritima TaxID=126957 RepID=T1IPW2_STRMM
MVIHGVGFGMEEVVCPNQTNSHHNPGMINENINNNIHKIKMNGTVLNTPPRGPYKLGISSDFRSSYNEHHSVSRSQPHRNVNNQNKSSPQRSQSERSNRWVWDDGSHVHATPPRSSGGLYRSNSSLDLDETLDDKSAAGLRREYGSASSIDMISTSGESFFAMLRDFRTDNPDQRSPGPAKIADYLRGRIDCTPSTQNASNALVNGSDALEGASSPKTKSKFPKLWETKEKVKPIKIKPSTNNEPSLFRKLRGTKSDATAETVSKGSDNSLDADTKLEEKLRRKAFAHYDSQSITANLAYAGRLRAILNKRRNTTTGASAASMSNRTTPHGSAEDVRTEENDAGDGRNNDLVLSCPFFRNELGGEEERVISLTRATSKSPRVQPDDGLKAFSNHFYKPAIVCGISVLEGAADYYWKKWNCPYETHSLQIENVDRGVTYYRKYFSGKEHQNWFGIDENLGPVAVSIMREKIEDSANSTTGKECFSQYRYRLIIRTSELMTLRGSVLEDAIPSLKPNSSRGIPIKEVLDYVAPELQLPCLRLGLTAPRTEEQLIKLDQQGVTNTYKVGIMYCKAGQATEEEMYNNEHSGPAFDEFLDMLGQRVRLKGFDKYRAQLDNKTDSTGLYSVYAAFQDCEIMFHVSSLLPYSANNRQQLLRKRHIGNDIVTIVFQEPDSRPFTPKNIRSQFQHVFIVIRAIQPCTDKTHYKVNVSRSRDVQAFGPPIPEDSIFPKSKAFADFLLAKIINAENAAHKSEKFATMATRTRQEYLKDLATNHITNTTLEVGSKFSLSFGVRKKEKPRARFIPDCYVKGAIVWNILIEDYGQARVINCFLGISGDTLILIEENSREPVFVCPVTSILGWSSHTNRRALQLNDIVNLINNVLCRSSLKIYYHQGECIVIRSRDPDVDEIHEIVSRLSCISEGCETQEFALKRNNIGQLGFHVQQDGTITEVENYGFAWQAGVRQGSRLVEICKVVVSAMTHDQMVDLLKTSLTVTITVIPPFPDHTPRRGCCLHSCSYLMSSSTISDYENVSRNFEPCTELVSRVKNRQQIAQSQIKVSKYIGTESSAYSTTSSGYSGSSTRSTVVEQRFGSAREINSSSSQSSEEKWYDVSEIVDAETRNDVQPDSHQEPVPPPLPARLVPTSHSAFSHVKTKRLPQDYPANYSAQHQHLQNRETEQLSSNYHDYASIGYQTKDYVQHDRLSSLRGSNQQLNSDKKSGVLASPAIVISDGHSDSSSDRFHGARSEDEQSGSSNSLSPRSRRRWPIDGGWGGSGSSSSSRTHSPRTGVRNDMSDIKLRSVANSRHHHTHQHQQLHQINRNSGQISSTFQEDLLKLINPDLINTHDDKTRDENSNRSRLSPPPAPPPSKMSSRENLSSSSSGSQNSIRTATFVSADNNNDADVIFTIARPATVISTTSSSSPAPSENKLSKEERLSPRVHTNAVGSKLKSAVAKPENMLPLPESKDIDWPSLVNTATKAMQVVGVPLQNKSSKPGIWITEVTDRLGLETPPPGTKAMAVSNTHRMRELEARVQLLEQELKRERHFKEALESEVNSLRQKNFRLQEESETAAAQLRRFTEWFFQTIDRQQ